MKKPQPDLLPHDYRLDRGARRFVCCRCGHVMNTDPQGCTSRSITHESPQHYPD